MPLNKFNKLKTILRGMRSVLVAFSGGVDSTFLLKAAKDALGDKVLAVTADSSAYPKEELIFSKKIAASLGVKHKIIRTAELKNNNFTSNGLNRCYFCKKELLLKLKRLAKKERLSFVVDATNVSDRLDFRPGAKAKKELGVRSPLEEAGFSKEQIRRQSKILKLPTWDKPSLACLASRIPYGRKISRKALTRIATGECFLRGLGFKQVRLRDYENLCRIEVEKNNIPKLFTRQKQVVDRLKKLGYNYVTVDLEGYRTGSMNPALPKRVGFAIGGRAG